MTKIAILPKDDNTNGWSALLPARQAKPALEGDIRADWVVIGAGFAGLAAARRLAENRPDEKIVLVEAHEAGEGASGRNSGFAIDLPHNVGSALEELDTPRRAMRLSRAAIDYLDTNIRARDIQCNWSPRGKYHAAVSPHGSRTVLEPFARELDALSEPYRWLTRGEVAAEIGTAYFHSAVHTKGGFLMNPAALTRGLADTMPANVTVHEHTPVTEARFENGVELTTPQGSLRAPTAILAVNGFASQFGFMRRALMVFSLDASLTCPLSADERRALGGLDDWGLTPANSYAGVTMRYTQDYRILIRQRFRFAPNFRRDQDDVAKIRAGHQQAFRRRFPMLPNVSLEHTWRGFVCMSRNHAPGFGRLGPHVFGAVCQNAVGVTRGTISGMLAADLACGIENPLIEDMENQGTPNNLPPRPFLDLGVQARFGAELLRGRSER